MIKDISSKSKYTINTFGIGVILWSGNELISPSIYLNDIMVKKKTKRFKINAI